MSDPRVAGTQRLREWPEVLSQAWLCQKTGWSPQQVAVYVNRWQQQGWLQRAGPRLGLYYNLLTSGGEVTGDMRLKALLTAQPTALLMGESVLHANAWTTQAPQSLSVAVLGSRTPALIDGFTLHPRPKTWYRAHQPCRVSPAEVVWPTYGLRALPPAQALVDLYADSQAWHPDPDDLDLDDEALAALRALSGNREGWPEWLSERVGTGSPAPPRRRSAP